MWVLLFAQVCFGTACQELPGVGERFETSADCTVRALAEGGKHYVARDEKGEDVTGYQVDYVCGERFR